MRVQAIVGDLAAAVRAIEAGATAVRLRVEAPTGRVIECGRGLRGLGISFVVYDDLDAALELGADGVQVGSGETAAAARARAAGLVLERAVASYEEAIAADADRLAVGPIWKAASKRDSGLPLGLGELARICAAVAVPVIAVGGIDASNASACIDAGAAGVAARQEAIDPELRRAVDEALAAR